MMRTWHSKQKQFIPNCVLCLVVVLVFMPVCSHIVHAQKQTRTSFPLSTLCLPNEFSEEYFPHGIAIHFDPNISRIHNTPVKEAYFLDTGEYIQTRLITTKLDRETETWYTVDFHPGFSLDPMFLLYHHTEHGDTRIGNVLGLEIVFPGDGYFYVSGHTNSEFNQRRKFTIRDGQIVEVPQPFYYVGLETHTLKELDIYADTQLTLLTAHLAKHEPVTVLINSDEFYLIKTSQGILGWAKIHVEQQATVIQGLYYFGD